MVDEKRKAVLAKKIDDSKKVIHEAFDRFPPEEFAIAWTGGKDSTLTLWIIRQACQERGFKAPKCLVIDEGDTFGEIEDFVEQVKKEWDLDVEVSKNEDVLKAAGYRLVALVKVADLNERNRAEIQRIGYEEDEFPFEAESFVGNHLMKTVVFNQFIERNNVKGIFQGLRWDEQAARRKDQYIYEREEGYLSPAHIRICPILHFTERDIWDTTLTFGIPFCELYKQGYRSLGAKTTSRKSSDIPAWEQDLEHTGERDGRRQDKEKAMERMRKLGYM
jgi:phosphoadenosine phosphosulfate reductase